MRTTEIGSCDGLRRRPRDNVWAPRDPRPAAAVVVGPSGRRLLPGSLGGPSTCPIHLAAGKKEEAPLFSGRLWGILQHGCGIRVSDSTQVPESRLRSRFFESIAVKAAEDHGSGQSAHDHHAQALCYIPCGICILGCSKQTKESRIEAAEARISSLNDAANLYLGDVGRYPESLNDLLTAPTTTLDGPKSERTILAERDPARPVGQALSIENIAFGQVRISSNGPDRKPGTEDDVKYSTRPPQHLRPVV